MARFPDDIQIEAAREAGTHYIEDGEILRAWPYFRALGERQPVIDAIEGLTPEQFTEEILSLSFQEHLNPKRALELLLASRGICRAITVFEQYPDPATWEEALGMLTRALHEELVKIAEERPHCRPMLASARNPTTAARSGQGILIPKG